ncbi:hypothetical protein FEDK69T_02000 [Flavobacterium enshiense DK69]|nr:hypothetical protein FEDK69T_02000 [Flavobacterium enshiense DK69]
MSKSGWVKRHQKAIKVADLKDIRCFSIRWMLQPKIGARNR